jgi:hypothetical protein
MQEEGNLPKAVQWIINNKNGCIAGVFCLFVFVFMFFRSSGEMPYFEAANAMSNWQGAKNEKTLDTLMAKLQKKGVFEEIYHAFFVEDYLEKGDLKNLERKVKKASSALASEFPMHSQFSQTSLKMEKGDFSQALKDTLSLKAIMEKQEKENTLLYKFNEFRLAIIYNKLEDRENEKIAIESMSTKLPLSEREISFSDYVESRKQELRS